MSDDKIDRVPLADLMAKAEARAKEADDRAIDLDLTRAAVRQLQRRIAEYAVAFEALEISRDRMALTLQALVNEGALARHRFDQVENVLASHSEAISDLQRSARQDRDALLVVCTRLEQLGRQHDALAHDVADRD